MITLCKAGVNDFTNKARLLFRMVERDLRSRYVGSLIGIFWTALHPLLLLLIFTFIFAVVFQAKFSGQTSVSYSALYILCGLIPWLGFQEGVARSVGYLVEHSSRGSSFGAGFERIFCSNGRLFCSFALGRN